MPSSIPQVKPGDVVYVNFIFTSQADSKRRPVVILSVMEYHVSRLDVIAMPLTTQPPNYFGDAPLTDWQAAGLPVKSNLKAVLQTIPRDTIEKVAGSLVPADLELARNAVRTIFGLT